MLKTLRKTNAPEVIPVSPSVPDPRLLVFFIHGLGGDALSYWGLTRHHADEAGELTVKTSPNLIDADSFAGKGRETSIPSVKNPQNWAEYLTSIDKRVQVFSIEYDANKVKIVGQTPHLYDRGFQILSRMEDQLAEYENVPFLFICHSYGGLMYKQMMLNLADDRSRYPPTFKSRFKGVVFLATPHNGAGLATLLKRAPIGFRKGRTVSDLVKGNGLLLELSYRFDAFFKDSSQIARNFIESKPTTILGIVFGAKVVDESSARSTIIEGNGGTIVPCNHRTIKDFDPGSDPTDGIGAFLRKVLWLIDNEPKSDLEKTVRQFELRAERAEAGERNLLIHEIKTEMESLQGDAKVELQNIVDRIQNSKLVETQAARLINEAEIRIRSEMKRKFAFVFRIGVFVIFALLACGGLWLVL